MPVARVRTGKPIERQGLSTAWERRVGRTATVFAVVTLIVSVGVAVGLTRAGISAWVLSLLQMPSPLKLLNLCARQCCSY